MKRPEKMSEWNLHCEMTGTGFLYKNQDLWCCRRIFVATTHPAIRSCSNLDCRIIILVRYAKIPMRRIHSFTGIFFLRANERPTSCWWWRQTSKIAKISALVSEAKRRYAEGCAARGNVCKTQKTRKRIYTIHIFCSCRRFIRRVRWNAVDYNE